MTDDGGLGWVIADNTCVHNGWLRFTALPCAYTQHSLSFLFTYPPNSIANGQKRKILQAAYPQREGIKDIEQGGRSSSECSEKDKAKE